MTGEPLAFRTGCPGCVYAAGAIALGVPAAYAVREGDHTHFMSAEEGATSAHEVRFVDGGRGGSIKFHRPGSPGSRIISEEEYWRGRAAVGLLEAERRALRAKGVLSLLGIMRLEVLNSALDSGFVSIADL